MADLQRAHEGFASERPATAPSSPRNGSTQAVRPRLGHGRTPQARRGSARVDGGVVLRALGISCAVAVLVLGGFFLLRGFGLEQRQESVLTPGPGAAVAVGGLVPSTAPPTPTTDARQIAALLSHEPAAAAKPPPQAAASATKVVPAPTAADFARPAFLEPHAADKADADATDDPIDDPSPEARATASAPVPPARPALAQASGSSAADNAEETGSVGQSGRINTAINLRSGPQRGAAVLATLEAGTKVTVYSCKSWCEVAADGKRGYVYRRAVDQ
ncbi:SH3 domain-containing protein [Xanthobacter agilis]|uniref:SH3b domain-containing protein n=1 Tax=Xanthobacter agilis TaxID=47492 RepID=A0ABU0LB97_XANAG|nr:SH3 domain-containing protein [Xanthobacter agilis]MDQ0504414.1 hypothetical protein [Xanthobacter agilis]